MGKKAKKKAKKKIGPLDQIRKELDKLESLHEKEDAIVEKISDILDEESFKDDEDFEWK
jgi:predicted DNA binding CopG/RHH family protein